MLAYDETTITKSGKKTYGIDQYYSGTHGHVVTGLSFGVLALVDVDDRNSHPVHLTQIVRSHALNPVITSPTPRAGVRLAAAKNHTKTNRSHQNWRGLTRKLRSFYTKITGKFLYVVLHLTGILA